MRPVTILYVEDSEDLRETIAMLLESPEREVKTCATGEEALACYAEHEYDILVTDVGLPGLSGTDLARKLLAQKPDRWVVLCSGYEFSEHLHLFGPNVRAVRKPFEPEDLEALMAQIIDRINASSQG
ncbi:MAG TPA: response regulator [Burkholderiaceae bacterium]|nr:response regulator [Burkholderiaceae bacterium]